jgi:hypothetical protein
MMKDIQTTWENVKKTVKFMWRHFFTLGILGLLLSIFIKEPLNWKNAFYMTCGAILLDWVKQFIKFTPNPKAHHFHSDSHAVSRNTLNDQWSNPNVMGTPAYLMRDSHYR